MLQNLFIANELAIGGVYVYSSVQEKKKVSFHYAMGIPSLDDLLGSDYKSRNLGGKCHEGLAY